MIFALQGQKRSGGLSARGEVVIILYFATLIKFPQANYLTFGGLLSRNAGDFFGRSGLGSIFASI